MVKINGHNLLLKEEGLSEGIKDIIKGVLVADDEWPNDIFFPIYEEWFCLCSILFLLAEQIILKKDQAINIFHVLAPLSDGCVMYEYIYQSKENNCSVVVL